MSAVLSVVEPISSGLGGGGLWLLHDAKSGKDIFVDARETAPAAANEAAYLNPDGSFNRDRAQNGPWSAGIPGLPAMLVHVAGKYGRLPLRQSLVPAIRIAREVAHANVCRTYDVVEADGHHFITMEFVDGRTLRAWLDAAPRSRAEIPTCRAGSQGWGSSWTSWGTPSLQRKHTGRRLAVQSSITSCMESAIR